MKTGAGRIPLTLLEFGVVGEDRGERAQDFDLLLRWLDEDRKAAEEKYAALRRRLIQVFVNRGALVPEDLADETISRVAAKVAEVKACYEGDPARYFYGVARNVLHEARKSQPAVSIDEARFLPAADPDRGKRFPERCFERCLHQLPADQRELILRYYENEKDVKILNRKALAANLGVDGSVMRLRVHRIRSRLKECLLRCVEETSGETISPNLHKGRGRSKPDG
jgi:DNA-directed RNA polymerase specialized sigma24 family protein